MPRVLPSPKEPVWLFFSTCLYSSASNVIVYVYRRLSKCNLCGCLCWRSGYGTLISTGGEVQTGYTETGKSFPSLWWISLSCFYGRVCRYICLYVRLYIVIPTSWMCRFINLWPEIVAVSGCLCFPVLSLVPPTSTPFCFSSLLIFWASTA